MMPGVRAPLVAREVPGAHPVDVHKVFVTLARDQDDGAGRHARAHARADVFHELLVPFA